MSETYYKIKRSTLDTLANGFQAACNLTEPLTPEQMIELLPDMYLDLTKTFADVPENEGVSNALARAALWRDISYTAQGTMYADDEDDAVVNAGDKVRGLWYSSTRGTDDFIGYAVSLYSLMTAINNPRSVLYTRRYSSYFANDVAKNGAENVYGSNCSEYVSWALGLPYLTVTNWLPKLECFVNENGEHDKTYGGLCWDSTAGAVDTEALRTELKLCDVLNSNYNFGGDAGHAVMVTGIRRNRKGMIQELDISEDWWASMTSSGGVKSFGCIKTTTYTWDEFVADYITTHGYRAYRYDTLASVPVPPDLSGIAYSDLCTSRGDRIAIRPDQDLALNVVSNADQYAGIVLLKDGAYYDHKEGTTDWRLIDPNKQSDPLTTGKYTAILYGAGDTPDKMTEANATTANSTRFIVCAVTVEQTQAPTSNGNDTYTSKYSYAVGKIGGEYPIPVQATAKVESGNTSRVVVLGTDEDYNGTGNFEITAEGGTENGDLAIVHVPFKTEYGFVIGEIGYDGNPLDKPKLPEDETTEPDEPTEEYVLEDVTAIVYKGRTQYIDTGVDMSQYNDTKLNYSYKGSVTATATDGTTYLFGALANDASDTGVRSGNAYISGTTISMYLGANSNAKTNTLYTDGKKVFELTAKNVCPSDPSKMTVEVDKESITLITTLEDGSIANTANLYLLAANIRGVDKGKHEGTFYGFTVTDVDNKVIYQATPCVKKRTSDGVVVEVGIKDHEGNFTAGNFTVADEG